MDLDPEQSTACETVVRRQEPQRLLADSLCSTNTPHRAPPESYKRPLRTSSGHHASGSFDGGIGAALSEDSINTADLDLIELKEERNRPRLEPMVLKPRKIIHPEPPPDPSIRRSTRNRMKPVRQWLGEKPVYAVSPGGGRTLQGVTEVEICEQRWLKVRTADYSVASQRELQIAARKRALREKRRQEARERKKQRLRELLRRHRRGLDLNITADSIVTSSDEEDSD
ncbi:hypothetical protein TELCIR_01337 [Teladorsagia circumcincta]|uniref:Uncharacterized protein n=1 Tax=Teladorsagia circumcincta TaxID=45464 RepID=A0A2G9V277_TELCI|nr:hypothetical protein TELCIR_01337 [Teladorsagia circumcincta]